MTASVKIRRERVPCTVLGRRAWTGAAVLFACSWAACTDGKPQRLTPIQAPGNYLSDVPLAAPPSGSARAADADEQPPQPEILPSPDDDIPGDPDRALAEAQVVQQVGDRLYVLNGYAGLNVFDVSEAGELRLLGGYPINAQPVEFHIKGEMAYVLLNDRFDFERDEGSRAWSATFGSHLLALSVADPANIEVVDDQPLAGSVDHSRLVGDILYVGIRPGSADNHASIASFDLSDATQLAAVDTLTFSTPGSEVCGQGAMLFDEHIYVVCSDQPFDASRSSTLYLVDYSAPTGELTAGATFSVSSANLTRFHLDEDEGILRVVGKGVVETFQIVSADEVLPLARTPLKFDFSRRSSVRFAGKRAYVLGFSRGTHALDLSDPLQPALIGTIDVAGSPIAQLHPYGDRLVAVGADYSGKSESGFVALLDASGTQTPVLLDRVNFGGTWTYQFIESGRLGGFAALPDQGQLAVAFAGNPLEAKDCGSRLAYRSGIQLIDVEDDDLVPRAIVPQAGAASRLLLSQDQLIALTDTEAASFDISAGDSVVQESSGVLSRSVSNEFFSGGMAFRAIFDHRTLRTSLEYTDLARAKNAEALGTLELPRWQDSKADDCANGEWWGTPVVHDRVAYVPHLFHAERDVLEVYIVDLTDPQQPELVGTLDLQERQIGFSTQDDLLVLTDHALLVDRSVGHYAYDPTTRQHAPRQVAYDVFDLKDPRAPRFTTHFELPEELATGGWGVAPVREASDQRFGQDDLLVDGDLILSQHEEATEDEQGRVRYYLDRLDVSDPTAPKLLEPINVPGLVVRFDRARNRLLTFDYRHRTAFPKVEGNCSPFSSGGYGWVAEDGACHSYDRRAHLVELEGKRALVLDTLEFDAADRVSTLVAATDERLFYLSLLRDPLADGDPRYAPEFHSVVLSAAGTFEHPTKLALELSETLPGAALHRIVADGNQALVPYGFLNQLVDTEDPQQPKLQVVNMHWDCERPKFYEGNVYCGAMYGGTLPLAVE